MKYHKIRNIPMHICTAEQKIAYNLAFSHTVNYRKMYQIAQCNFQKREIITSAVHWCITLYQSSYEYAENPKKYNIDGIFTSLMAGMENYFNGKEILCSFSEIGETFPANYL